MNLIELRLDNGCWATFPADQMCVVEIKSKGDTLKGDEPKRTGVYSTQTAFFGITTIPYAVIQKALIASMAYCLLRVDNDGKIWGLSNDGDEWLEEDFELPKKGSD
jgi:hypothetical protein